MTLDEFQLKAYNQKVLRDTALVIEAVAGSGKSTTMVSKAYRFIKIGFKPENILLTTFSNKSAKDLKDKFKKTFGAKVKGTPMITTLHSFGIEVLREYFNIQTPIILTEWKALVVLRDIGENMKLFIDRDTGIPSSKRNQIAFVKQVYDALDFLKSNMIIQSIADISTGKILVNDYIDKSSWFTSELFAQIVVQYENVKRERGFYDYNDLIFRVYYEMVKRPKVLEAVRNQYKIAIIDEAQDLDSSQWALIILISRGQRLICVGDKMQNIYNFRYSVPQNFSVKFLSKFFTNVIQLSLENNYRSTKNIVDIGNAIRFLGKDSLLSKSFKPKENGSVRFVKVKNNLQEGTAIANEVQKALQQGYSLRDITIICRSNNYIKTNVEPALVRNKLPYKLLSRQIGKKLTDKPANTIYFNILSLLINPNDITSLADLSEFVVGCGDKFASEFGQQLLRTGDIRYVNMGNANLKKLNNVKHLFNEIQKLKKSINSVKLVSKMLDSIGYLISMYLKPELVTPKERETIEQVISNWVNYYRQEGLKDIWQNLNQVLFEVNNFDDSEDEDKIQVGTTHSQKGLEMPVSIVAGFVGYKQRPDLDNDAINVLYVQLSRAMDKLIVINSEDYVLKDGSTVKGAMLNQMRLLLSLLKGD